MMGKWGVSLWLKAQGQGSQSLNPPGERKSISHDSTLPRDSSDPVLLRKILAKLTEETAYELRREGWKTQKVTLKLRYSDFKTYTKQVTISPTNHDDQLLDIAWHLFQDLHSRRVQIRLIGISLGQLKHEYTLNLFEDNKRKDQLYKVMDCIKMRFGKKSIARGACA